MSILDAIARANRPLRITDLVEACDLPKATVHRICGLLCEAGFLRPELSGKGLEPGIGLRELSRAVLANVTSQNARHAVLESVARRVGETCNLAAPDGLNMTYWDRVETEWPLKVQMPIGTRVPMHCTASGKMFLSSLPIDRRRRLIARLDLSARTPRTITDPGLLEAELARVDAAQMATDDQEFNVDMVAIAVPVTDSSGRLFATLSVHAPVSRMSIEQARSHVPLLRAAAEEIGADASEDISASPRVPRASLRA